MLNSSNTINLDIIAWTNSFIRIYPKLTTIVQNEIFLVRKSVNPPQQEAHRPALHHHGPTENGQDLTGLLLIISAFNASPAQCQESWERELSQEDLLMCVKVSKKMQNWLIIS